MAKDDKGLFGAGAFSDVMDELFAPFTKSLSTRKEATATALVTKAALPKHTTTKTEGGMTLAIDLAGIDPKTMSLARVGNLLVMRYARGEAKCKVTYTLSDGYDIASANAHWLLGQLCITVTGTDDPPSVSIPIDIR
jgi:hypothetical protein